MNFHSVFFQVKYCFIYLFPVYIQLLSLELEKAHESKFWYTIWINFVLTGTVMHKIAGLHC